MKRHKNVSIFLKGNEDNCIYTSMTELVGSVCLLQMLRGPQGTKVLAQGQTVTSQPSTVTLSCGLFSEENSNTGQ